MAGGGGWILGILATISVILVSLLFCPRLLPLGFVGGWRGLLLSTSALRRSCSLAAHEALQCALVVPVVPRFIRGVSLAVIHPTLTFSFLKCSVVRLLDWTTLPRYQYSIFQGIPYTVSSLGFLVSRPNWTTALLAGLTNMSLDSRLFYRQEYSGRSGREKKLVMGNTMHNILAPILFSQPHINFHSQSRPGTPSPSLKNLKSDDPLRQMQRQISVESHLTPYPLQQKY